ncbi:glycosyltransferase [Cytobacillus firmus]|uniref:glycosyltransferase n=1 Tax=Cytobacillus firmus TaxID=1399 RepID=UPI001C8D2009|nr:glycosyltransferase [Cytobacillus firmus]MBX9974446.1 glycosyltransferase [Cytobacillus firmus]
MKRTILYLGNFSFPLGNAAGKRVYSNGKMLRELGYKIIFIGMNKEVDSLKPLTDTKNMHDGFTYYNFPYPSKNIEWMNYQQIFSSLIKFLKSEKIIDDLALVIYYGSPAVSLFNTKLIRFCKKQDIKIVTDCVDWLTTKTNNPFFNFIKWADNSYQKAIANKKTDGVIAISSYLSNYYKKQGNKTVIIPPLSPDDNTFEVLLNNSTTKVITYAGLPFRKGQLVTDYSSLKDRIDVMINLLYQAKLSGCRFIFNIYGFTKEDYLIVLPSQKEYIDMLGDSVVFHGHKTNEEVVEKIRNSDFTILIRDVNRDTTAGFPTKVSESISCGTPVITTSTSDLEKYIEEGKNGFLLNMDENISANQICEILNINTEEIHKMKNYCKESNPFHYKKFEGTISDFLKDI